ncbi:hypothetical protein GCM10011575_41570 [Microlunatus endophyticus]|uniref:Uncharacterized protein n=1 Tax=Microlunatus endophyticus TaxID=1716077 RepID=A0A917SGF3_9ACTN|nr:hypothetical protein GCM10011575_41570 [Microlunatus endophyticus]
MCPGANHPYRRGSNAEAKGPRHTQSADPSPLSNEQKTQSAAIGEESAMTVFGGQPCFTRDPAPGRPTWDR